MNIISLIGLTGLFFGINKYISSRYENVKLVTNYTSAVHAYGSVIFGLTFYLSKILLNRNLLIFENFIILFSTSYFIYDSYITIITLKGIHKYLYLYHHLISIIVLNSKINFPIIDMLILAEISNLPYYIVYDYIHQPIKDQKKIVFWKNIQKINYVIIRIPIFAGVIINYQMKNKITWISYVSIPMYFLGILWSFKLFRDK